MVLSPRHLLRWIQDLAKVHDVPLLEEGACPTLPEGWVPLGRRAAEVRLGRRLLGKPVYHHRCSP